MITGVSERVNQGGSIMTLKETAIQRIVAQFKRPSGFWGPAVGWIMASRSSNRRRNAWTVSLLNIESNDRILEIGFGPGIALQEISRIAVYGYVFGLDYSVLFIHHSPRPHADDLL